MIQSAVLENAHSDLVTDAAYDYYGLRLATCSLDQRIKIWQLDESTRNWNIEDDWKAHDATVSKVCWAHPEFGSIIASSSFDRTVKIWEHVPTQQDTQQPNGVASASTSKWAERAVLLDARGTVRCLEFGPRHFGLKLAVVSSDSYLRIYECLEQSSLTTWQLLDEIDIAGLSPALHSRLHTHAIATPTQSSPAHEGGASASLVAQALANQQQGLSQSTSRTVNKEADGGWCLSWCKERYWGEILAVTCGTAGVVQIIQLASSRRATTLLTLDPHPAPASTQGRSAADQLALAPPTTTTGEAGQQIPSSKSKSETSAITTVSWAPSCGRSYHLVATGGRDGHVRIWKLRPPEDDVDGEDDPEADTWTASIVADFDDHNSPVGKVEWNITGSILSSVGNDGQVRLWKATPGAVWRSAGSIGVEQNEEGQEKKDGMQIDAPTS